MYFCPALVSSLKYLPLSILNDCFIIIIIIDTADEDADLDETATTRMQSPPKKASQSPLAASAQAEFLEQEKINDIYFTSKYFNVYMCS